MSVCVSVCVCVLGGVVVYTNGCVGVGEGEGEGKIMHVQHKHPYLV